MLKDRIREMFGCKTSWHVQMLQKERDTYKKALEEIAKGDGFYGAQAYEYKQIARKALGWMI